MWQEVGRQIFGAPRRCFGTSTNGQYLQLVTQNNRNEHKLDRSNSLPQFKETTRAYEWYQTLNCAEKEVLENMFCNFTSHGVKIKTLIKLIAQKFNISQRFVGDIIAWWRKGWSARPPEKKIKTKIRVNSAWKLVQWQKIAVDSKHNYAKETLLCLLDEEAKQETT